MIGEGLCKLCGREHTTGDCVDNGGLVKTRHITTEADMIFSINTGGSQPSTSNTSYFDKLMATQRLDTMYLRLGKMVYDLSNTEGVMLSICRNEEYRNNIPEGGYDYCKDVCPDKEICKLKQEIKKIIEKN